MRRLECFLGLGALALAACGGNSDAGPGALDTGTALDDAASDSSVDDAATDSATPSDAATDTAPSGDTATDPGDTSPPDAFVTAAHLPSPQIATLDGALLSPTKVVTITASGDPEADSLSKFGDALAASQWWTTMRGVFGLAAATNVNVTGPDLSGTPTMTLAQMTAYVQALIDAGTAPALDGNTVYVLYLPDGVVVSFNGTLNTNCSIEGGAHLPFAKGVHDNLAYVQRCGGNTAQGLAETTNIGAHEVIEASTDPTLSSWGLPAPTSQPWTTDAWRSMDFGYQTEVGDMCGGTVYVEGGFSYARAWSNAAAAAGGDPCVPALTDVFYDVSPDKGWTPVAAGASADIPVTGWSTAPTSDWAVSVAEYYARHKGEVTATLKTPRTHGIFKESILNNGEVGTLHVTVPATAKSGDWVVFAAYSQPLTPSATSDGYHVWPVGVYVP